MAEQKKRRRRFGDRPEGYLLHDVDPMIKITPFIMPMRCDACNTYSDRFDVTVTDKFCREMVKSGKTNFSLLHVFLAAYVRTISQRPGLNRFISGQRLYHRHDIEVIMVVKKTMERSSEETAIKVKFDPDDTIEEIYDKFNVKVEEVKKTAEKNSSLDKTVNSLLKLPRPILRGAVGIMRFLDYFGLLPKALRDVSPFHGSMIITSMGSLGIRPIYHHIYNFGNLPVFLSYGGRKSVVCYDGEGGVYTKKFVELKAVLDERICDGFYYASSFKLFKRYVENPEVLLEKPEEVLSDAD